MLNLALTFPLVLSLAQSPSPSDTLEQERVVGALGTKLDAQLTRFAEYGFWGSVLVVRDGKIALLKGYGLADAERRIPNGAATRFELNSMTKMFTGVAILQLDAAGRLHVTDSVERYLGPFPAVKQGATIEQLASHTAGLIEAGADLAGDSRDAFVKDVKQTPRESPPGEQYRYTNAGYSLLAAIIEQVTGGSYEDYLVAYLFKPAGMRSATFRDRLPQGDPRFARGYVGTPAQLQPGPPNPYVWGTRGAGGVWATVGDVYRWLLAVQGDSLLPTPQHRLLFSPPKPPSQEAYGWHVTTDSAGRPLIHKGGGSDDFASDMLHYPRERVTIIWASNNLRQRWRRTLNRTLSALAFDNPGPPLPQVVSLPVGALARQARLYRSGMDSLQLRAGSGYLYAESNQLGVPTELMFFPQDTVHFTGFDPVSGNRSRLRFAKGSVTVELPDGRILTARERGPY
ncbi:MAG TPA: serine hydrolase domain-containing protein [Gemmatimonadales bacterium]|jgi:CubicO group peptidase (beta-lactamase class C family)